MNNRSTLFSTLLRVEPLKWQRVLEHSRMIKSYLNRVLSFLGLSFRHLLSNLYIFPLIFSYISFPFHFAMATILRPLSPHRTRVRTFLYSFLILFTLLAVFYLICMIIGSIAFFQAVLWKIRFSLGGRALSFALCKLGCAGGLALAMGGFALRALVTSEEFWGI